MKMTGHSVNPPRGEARVPINITPKAQARLRHLLFEPEMRAVGYSEFVERACEIAEEEIAESRRNRQDANG